MPDKHTEKLQKVLARLGYGSRRELEQWIRDGRVSVNGSVAKLGDRVNENDQIRVDGHRVSKTRVRAQRTRVLIYHKPAGEVTSRSDPEGRATVFDRLPKLGNGRWIAIGRLDMNTSGLLLFTTNGELANKLMHPSSEVEREYAVRVYGEVGKSVLNSLREGVELEDGPARFEFIRDAGGEGKNHWYHVILKEGRNREVRRLWESQGVTVSRLHRIRYGTVKLERSIRSGRWEDLSASQIMQLMKSVGMKADIKSLGPRDKSRTSSGKSPWTGRKRRERHSAR